MQSRYLLKGPFYKSYPSPALCKRAFSVILKNVIFLKRKAKPNAWLSSFFSLQTTNMRFYLKMRSQMDLNSPTNGL